MSTWPLSLYQSLSRPSVRTPLWIWWRRYRTRNALRQLDARMLADIGRSEAERRRECAKWFWQD